MINPTLLEAPVPDRAVPEWERVIVPVPTDVTKNVPFPAVNPVRVTYVFAVNPELLVTLRIGADDVPVMLLTTMGILETIWSIPKIVVPLNVKL